MKQLHISIFFLFLISLSSNGFTLTGKQKKEIIFDGKTLNGWKKVGGTAVFNVEVNAIVERFGFKAGNTFLITEKHYGDFIMELDVMMDDALTNSGVQLRSFYNDIDQKVYGLQYETDATPRGFTGALYDPGRKGWVYPLTLNLNAKSKFEVGKFNHIRIESIVNETRTWINDIPASYVIDTTEKKGFIGLQMQEVAKEELAGKKVYFKNITIHTQQLAQKPLAGGLYVVNHL